MRHLSRKEKELYVFGKMKAEKITLLEEHLKVCKKCYNEILFMRIGLAAKSTKVIVAQDDTVNKILLRTPNSDSQNSSRKEVHMKTKKFTKATFIGSLALAAIITSVVFFNRMKKQVSPVEVKSTPFAVITFVVGNVSIGQSQDKTTKARVKSILKEGDWLITKANSHIVFQIKDYGVFRVLANSKLQIDKEFRKNNSGQLNLKSGKVFSNMFKLKQNQSFKIKTPSAVAAVRGTKFLVSDSMKKPEVFVSRGKVEVSFKNKPKKKLMIKAGQLVVLKKKKIKIQKLNKPQALLLKKYAVVSYQKNFMQKSDSVIKASSKEIVKEEKKVQKEIKIAKKEIMESLSPVARLRAQGKLLSKIYLTDGSQLIGSVVSQDEKILKLDTGSGKIKILKSDIKKLEFVK